MNPIENGYYQSLEDALKRQKNRINKSWLILFGVTCVIFIGAFSQKAGKVVVIKEYKDSCCYNYTDSMECLNNQIIYYKKFYKPIR